MSDCSEAFEKTYKDAALEDQFSDRTRAVRRNLLLLVTMALLLSFPEIKFGNFLWLDISEEKYVDIARGLVAIIMALELIVFISYGVTDFLNWKTKKYVKVYEFHKTHTKLIYDYAVLADKHLTDITDSSINLTSEDLKNQKKNSNNFKDTIDRILIHDAEARVSLGKSLTMFNALLWFRIFIIDWLIPLAGAIMALMLNYEFMIHDLKIFTLQLIQ